ncbi:alkaline-phosphatase-like protein [Leucosporidium creatinivorum]|uniref:alkaline phosphatase n=1 Tax=Leucosporidium creatinivorum TaxID=106004 RepID=A0A1Y2DJP6_9BASI|nr:alkaline-phosphatase-like protein [Leucosporidium creatinivorum]
MVAQAIVFTLAALAATASAQTYRRTGACPQLGCIWPPDQSEFIAGQVFDIRLEVQAPANGSAPFNGGVPYPEFVLEIGGHGTELTPISNFYQIAEPPVEEHSFSYYEDLFYEQNKTKTLVHALSKSYRHVTLYNPGEYVLKLSYNGGMTTIAHWTVLPLAEKPCAKNVILFIGDGMTSSMATAARMLGHKSINGKYQSRLALDDAPGFGLQMTHSIDSFITDSANSATALYSGKKATVNGLNAYTDSTGDAFNDPKFETVFEMGRRINNAQVGIVSLAAVSDATPAAVVAHTSQRSQSDAIVKQFLEGVTSNFSWTQWDGPDVLFGGGAADFLPRPSNNNESQIDRFAAKGYGVVHDNSSLWELPNTERALGLFSSSTMPTWLDRNVFTKNMETYKAWDGSAGTPDVPGLKDMTLKAIDILHARSKAAGTPFMLMSEAASIDKQMHISDYDRALGELLELDATVRATLQHLKDIGEDENTLVVVTADHGHGFDVFGSADTEFLIAQETNSTKRGAIGTYQQSGLSAYQVAAGNLPTNNTKVVGPHGEGFPVNWSPRYAAAWGLSADVDRFENFVVHDLSNPLPLYSPRENSVELESGDYEANPEDGKGGFFVSGVLPVSGDQGVHSLTDVPVYSWGPGHELFRGIQNSVDIAFK